MEIHIATIVNGSETPAGDGISGALRCVIRLQDGTKRSAILKRGPVGQIMAEAFSALLLSKWNLPVPLPFLIDEAGAMAFASADVGYPNLKQSLNLDSLPKGPAQEAALQVCAALACSLPTTPLAAACDEAIDNRDRNLGNILWDGNTEAWIDHALALGQGSHLQDANKLCDMALFIGQDERLQRSAIAQALLLDRSAPASAETALSSVTVPTTGVVPLIATRLNAIGNRLVARFPRPLDLLTNHDRV
ncbi:hypothetical protein ACI48D_22465 [Massilia sp. LXY-6]|uniref:hypothetical protein n=1 Tax=Massilia sp. LXY-6 TaxID=3379823 RepID=UPI003EE421F4